jgi:type II secretory pathway pseudopilin PulG
MKINNKATSISFHRAFSLIELLGIMSIIGIIIGVITYPMLGWIERQRLQAERENLNVLKKEIEASFFQGKYIKNISAIPSDMPPSMVPATPAAEATSELTLFDEGVPATDEGFYSRSWYAKLASLRGSSGFSGTTLAGAEGSLRDVAYNMYGSRRILIAGPYGENDGQRYLLLSLMFSRRGAAGELAFATPPDRSDKAAFESWFNSLYAFDWNKGDTAADLVSQLADGTSLKWVSPTSSKLTYAQRVVAVRIVQPRFHISINNTTNDDGVDLLANVTALDSLSDADVGERERYPTTGTGFIWNTTTSHGVAENGKVGIFPKGEKGILMGRKVLVLDKNAHTKLIFPIESSKVITYQNGIVTP